MFTVGTAGHVDHGKSTLVKALTGIDPDRLREEKERGMTIDLGFAWLVLPSGREISIVDVPGHERFIKNMLAGVGGIDLAVLVVAADEGVMPQTVEHLAILDLLQVRRGLVAITKKDLVEPEWLEMVGEDISEHLKGTVLEDAPLLPVSAVTGEGLDELRQSLDAMLAETPAKVDRGRPRLPVDRIFTIAGFGTVVTGTLVDGRLQVGQEVEIVPRGVKSRVRGLQTHKHKVETALPGTRVAVNLGGTPKSEVARGDVLTVPSWLVPTAVADVRLHVLRAAPKPLGHNAVVSLHVGAAETVAKVALLDKAELRPGESGWAQLRMAEQIAVVKGDLFVIRSPNETVGGGEVVEPHPKRHRRFQAAVIERLDVLQKGTPAEVVAQALEGSVPLDVAAVSKRSGLPMAVAREALGELVSGGQAVRVGDFYITSPGLISLRAEIEAVLNAYHRQFALRAGMSKEELKSRLGLPAKVFTEVLSRLIAEQLLVEGESLIRLASHAVRFTAHQERQVEKLMAVLQSAAFSPPSRVELEQELGLEPEVINALLDHGKLAKLNDSVVFRGDSYREMVAKVVEHLRAHGKITVAEVRDMFGTSRKYALALMEHLDEIRLTRRLGDERVLR